MEISNIILFVGILIFAAHFFAWLSSVIRIPDVLLLLGIGLLVGPVFQVLTPEYFGQAGALFVAIVLTIILFESGLYLRFDVIREAWRNALGLTLLSYFGSMIIVGLLLWLFAELPPVISFMIGAIVGGTSAAVVVPMSEHLRLQQESRTVMLLESALTDVLAVVLTIGFLSAYQSGHFRVGALSFSVIVVFLGAVGIGVFGALIWSLLLNRVRRMENSIFSTPAYVFLLYGISEKVGVSGPIAALAFGVMLGNIGVAKQYLSRQHILLQFFLQPLSLSRRERAFFSEIVFVLQTFFFVYVGLSIPLKNGFMLAASTLLIIAILIIRLLVVQTSVSKKLPMLDRLQMGAMLPKGLAAAVLATFVAERHIPYGDLIQELVYAIILISIIVSSILIFFLARLPDKQTASSENT